MRVTKQKPLAIIATRVYEPEGTAAAYRLSNLAAALVRAGYRTRVLTTRAPGARRSTAEVSRWPVLRDRSGSVRGYIQYASFDIPLFFRLLFGVRADVVIAEPPPTTGVVTRVACWIRKTPYVYYSADVTFAAVKGVGAPAVVANVVRSMERWVLNGATAILAVTDGVKNELKALVAQPSKIAVVGTGVDTERFTTSGPVESPGFRYFIYAGTMSEFQGVEVFIDAFAIIAQSHPDVKMIMFGGGVDVESLQARASQLNGRVHFPGSVSAETIARWLRGAVVSLASVRPGRGYDFALPTKTLVSVACGTPVIFSGAGPMRALVVNNELGWATEWCASQIATAMEAALEAPHRCLSVASRQWLEQNYSLAAAAGRAAVVIAALAPVDGKPLTPK